MKRLRTILIVSVFTSSAIVAPLAGTSVYFVAAWGAPLGDGTWEHPLDLATSLSSKSPAGPGDILVLRGGTYRGSFVSTLTGAANNPITVRQAPGARATIDGSLTVQGAWATYWDLEVTNSSEVRTEPRPTGVVISGPHTKFINMVVHDAGNGMAFWTPAVDSEIYGCLIYDNGWQGPDPDRGHGHGIYTQNQTGTKRIVDNVLFNGYGYGIHAYTEGGSLSGFHIEGNTVFNSGSATRQGHHYDNILVGGLRPAERIELIGNYTYHTPGKGGRNRLGYSAPNKDVLIRDNYFAGGNSVLSVNGWQKVTMVGNTFFGLQNLLSLTRPAGTETSAYQIDTNLYVGGEAATPFSLQNQSVDFAQWQQVGNFDHNSRLVATSSKHPVGTKIFIRPNQYEPGRANVIVYNWQLKSNVEVDLREVLTMGAPYEVRNV
jgi:Right handed beta helix region